MKLNCHIKIKLLEKIIENITTKTQKISLLTGTKRILIILNINFDFLS